LPVLPVINIAWRWRYTVSIQEPLTDRLSFLNAVFPVIVAADEVKNEFLQIDASMFEMIEEDTRKVPHLDGNDNTFHDAHRGASWG